MATLVLETAGAALGQTIAGPLGAMAGQAAGLAAGALLQPGAQQKTNVRIGPRLQTMGALSSNEGAAIPRIYGRARVGGQIIWASRFVERSNVSYTPASGGKASKPSSPASINVSYSYYANFAVGLCEGPIAFVRRIWADGQELEQIGLTFRVYRGDETQAPDPLIAATEAPGATPAYRGLAYIVFENFPLEAYGNRIPQLTFEVVKPVAGLGAMIKSVNLIPGASEFGYATQLQTTYPGPGVSVQENRHQTWAQTDWRASLSALMALCPNLKNVNLVVCWFGDDLRAGNCTIAPRVELAHKMMWYYFGGGDWSVAGLNRSAARVVTSHEGVASAGGSPSDSSVKQAIADLKAHGLSVTLYPFLMMDIAADNALPNPWTGAVGQPAYPWRGRIVCDPAPDRNGTVDATPAAATQIASFFGAAAPGASEWSYRKFIFHYAHLCAEVGGVDAFLVGSELPGLTRVRTAPGVYPAAQALAQLAGDVKNILGAATKVSYAADWTEYGAHVLSDGAEVRFPLDIIWASPAVDFVGIDAYWPLSDWRDGDHLDAQSADSIYDLDYLARRIGSGEAYDWHYATHDARIDQIRAPITDGAYGKPWVFRQKDIANWWANAHFERVAGVERATPTQWAPASKPIWILETGCAAVDRGANAPNVFPDLKSSENGLPYFSRGGRDDLMQARVLEAWIRRFDPAHPDFDAAHNPVSPAYGARMVCEDRLSFWAWDARPFPAFPELSSQWADADNWRKGHWLNGRLEGAPVDRLVAALVEEMGDASPAPRAAIEGFVDGFVIDRTMSMRAAIEQLASVFSFDPVFSSGALRFASRRRKPILAIASEDLAPFPEGDLVRRLRGQESELPHEFSLTFADSERDYASATVASRRLAGYSKRKSEASVAIIAPRSAMQVCAETMLEDAWVGRETIEFRVSPNLQIIEIGDVVTLAAEARPQTYLVQRIEDGAARHIHARRIDASIFDQSAPDFDTPAKAKPKFAGPPLVVLLDLAVARGAPTTTQYIAACADPWPGALTVLRKTGDALDLLQSLATPATIGETLTALPAGPLAQWCRNVTLDVRLYAGALTGVGEAAALQGAANLAICGADGAWEIIAFAQAELIGQGVYRLSQLLRGLGGEQALAERATPAGARVVLLDGAVAPLGSGPNSIGLPQMLRVAARGRETAPEAFVELEATPSAKALTPYPPAQPRAVANGAGVWISFERQTRIDGDTFELAEPPLGEEQEAYEIAIARPGQQPRMLRTSARQALYAAADIGADFATAPQTLDLEIRQISAIVGPGFACVAQVQVRRT